MSKKLERNGLWESSRMMLPEHKEAILEQRRGIGKKSKPALHEDETERITQMLWESWNRKRVITVTTFDEFSDRCHTGIVIKIDPDQRTIRLRGTEHETELCLDDIVRVH